MRITSTAIRRGVTCSMLYLVAVGFGLFSLGRLRIDLWPQLDFPMIALITQYRGAGPFDMEAVVTRPLEEALASVKNVKKVSSISRQGLSLIMLEFEWGTDMDQAEIDVRKALEWVEDLLPPGTTDPLVFAFDPAMQPIAFYTVGSPVHGLAELRRLAEFELEPRIERIPGVASAFTIGGLKREIRVALDPARMRARGISLQQVEMALQANNQQVAAGWLEDAEEEFTLQAWGEYRSLQEIEETAVATVGGTTVRIRDVADVIDGFVETRSHVWTNGEPAVILMVQRQSDANTVDVTRRIHRAFPSLREALPKEVSIETVWEQANFINRSMTNLSNAAVQAVVLAVLVLLFFLRNLKSSLMVAVSIPVSMVVTFAVMQQAGLTLNMISMAGLALAVGLLVDNSIVVLESIHRHRERGLGAREAAEVGTGEVAMAITASTLTTAAVFIPVLFVPGIAGEMFNDMVLTICFSLGTSLVVALTLVPLMASRLLRVEQTGTGVLGGLGARIGTLIEDAKASYVRVLRWALSHRLAVLAGSGVAFALSVVVLVTRGGEFVPHSDMGYVQMAYERSPGTSLQSTATSVRTLEAIVGEHVPEAELVYTNFGQGEGMFAAFSARGSNEGEMMIKLKPRSQRSRSVREIEAALRPLVTALPDLTVRFEDRGAQAIFGGEGDIAIGIFGHDLEVAEAIARDVVARIKDIRGVVGTRISVEEAAPELKIELDRQRIADLGLSTSQVSHVISTCMLGSVPTRYREGGDEFDVRVQLKDEARRTLTDLGDVLVMTPLGKHVPLRSLATFEYARAPIEITREDQERKVTVSVDVGGRDLRSTTRDVQAALKRLPLPSDFRIEIGGAAQSMMESFLYLGVAFLVAMALTYMVMASQFESLVDPFVIMFTIPLSLIGVALGLTLTGTTLNVMSLVGIIMLVGIIVNNGIVLVDYTNQLRARGHGLHEAILLAGEARMRPVLMTALTTILAMLPLALGLGESGENWAPMARALIGGLLVGTALTLVVVPVMYSIVERRARLGPAGP